MNLSNEFPLKHRDEFNETFIPTREAGLKRLKEFHASRTKSQVLLVKLQEFLRMHVTYRA